MKRNKWFGWALAAIMTGASFTACTNETEEVLAQSNEIKLTSAITPVSRVADQELQSTQIVENQEIGLTITGAKSEHNNVNWIVNQDGTLTNQGSTPYWGTGNIEITAYHPYNQDWSGTTHTFSVNTDQSNDLNYLNSDLLWVKTTACKSTDPIALQFVHKLAKITIGIQHEDQTTDITSATISICGTKTTATFNLSTGEITNPNNPTIDIKAAQSVSAAAIIIPQTVAAGTKFIKIEFGKKTFYYTLIADKTFESGKSYDFTLTLKEKEAKAILISHNSGGKITDWLNESNSTKENAEEDASQTIPYLTFSAEREQTLKMSKAIETLEYSINGKDWKELGTTEVIFGGTNGNLRLRGMNIKGTANTDNDFSNIRFSTSTPVTCNGDIRTLLDYTNHTTVDTKNARFCSLFRGNNVLISAPELPATTLASFCYESMFRDCTNLAQAPKLPATTLASNCYNSMFFNCTSLVKAPNLPAIDLYNSCYSLMFCYCSSLIQAPELPATNLANSCYSYMFSDCLNLSLPPELPATNLTERCYDSMFNNCTNLTQAPKLSANNLASFCYSSMFKDCINLTQAPELPANVLIDYCYSKMFFNCYKLNSITMLATKITGTGCLNNWVESVSPIGTFIKDKTMVSLPTGINGIPEGWAVNEKE